MTLNEYTKLIKGNPEIAEEIAGMIATGVSLCNIQIKDTGGILTVFVVVK